MNITMRVRDAAKWRRQLTVLIGRRRWMPYVEIATLSAFFVIAISSYLILTRGTPGEKLLTPPVVALMLVANLVPAIALLVLIGRRVAKRRAAASPVGGRGRLHVRLVGIFSLVASVPLLLVVIVASVLFQYGVQFWYSDQARGLFEGANELSRVVAHDKRESVIRNTEAMANDLSVNLSRMPMESRDFAANFALQVYYRELSEGAVLAITPRNGVQTLAVVNPYERPTGNWVPPEVARSLLAGKTVVQYDSPDRLQAVTVLPGSKGLFLYASHVNQPRELAQAKRFSAILTNYNALLERSRRVQLQFNAALFVISLLIVGAAVAIALGVADRLVRPVGELVAAARKVAAGDLSARVASPSTRDEVGTLATAFNRMTRRLQEQTGALESRRALIEAVLTGVSAGVVSIDSDRSVRLMNASARGLLGTGATTPLGMPLARLAPELDAMLDRRERETIIQLDSGIEPRTLAVKIVTDERGHVLTFDDITQQLLDQRRAAWSDVARRIAHEIKNPLTPIQLAAERLKRRYAREITSDPATFERLTDTIVRQVGDLRRMVDEFSSFARMPKPVFRDEILVDIARQALFLHEVAHPAIRFTLDAADPGVRMVCDRRQLGQALTNIVKNAVEAIAQQPGGEDAGGTIAMTLAQVEGGEIAIDIADSGVGLPPERDRLVEPYVTTRARGTGLGLAIVKKIVEEHCGIMSFSDRQDGGTIVHLGFDRALLAPLAGEGDPHPDELAHMGTR